VALRVTVFGVGSESLIDEPLPSKWSSSFVYESMVVTKLPPPIVMLVPPAEGPLEGEALVTDGAAASTGTAHSSTDPAIARVIVRRVRKRLATVDARRQQSVYCCRASAT
jgi:hypothetical protein